MNTPISAILERKGPAVHAVPSTYTIDRAVDEMNRHRIGSIVVMEGNRLAGIFTERDVLRRVVGAGVDPRVMRVADVMTRDLITISPHTSIEQTMVLFAEKRVRHLPVISHGEMIGLISIGDISRWISDAHRAEAEHLKNYIAGGYAT
jgi:CBS domain-containing protein